MYVTREIAAGYTAHAYVPANYPQQFAARDHRRNLGDGEIRTPHFLEVGNGPLPIFETAKHLQSQWLGMPMRREVPI